MLKLTFYKKYKISKEIEKLENDIEYLKSWHVNITTNFCDHVPFISDETQESLRTYIYNEVYKQRDLKIKELETQVNRLINTLDQY